MKKRLITAPIMKFELGDPSLGEPLGEVPVPSAAPPLRQYPSTPPEPGGATEGEFNGVSTIGKRIRPQPSLTHTEQVYKDKGISSDLPWGPFKGEYPKTNTRAVESPNDKAIKENQAVVDAYEKDYPGATEVFRKQGHTAWRQFIAQEGHKRNNKARGEPK